MPASAEVDPTSGADVIPLTLRRMEIVEATVKAHGQRLAVYSIAAPSEANPYTVPIPKAALFGAETFTLTLSDAGAIVSVGYKNTDGTAKALETAGTVAKGPPEQK